MTTHEKARVDGLTRHGPACGFLDGDAHLSRAFFLPGHVFVQPGVGLAAKAALQLSDGKREQRSNIHASKDTPSKGSCNPLGLSSQKGHNSYAGTMDRWPQRPRFFQLVREYAERNKATNGEIADLLDIKLSYLKNILYREDKVPGWDLMQRAATLFGVSASELVDDPNAQPAGQDLSNQSEYARFLATVIVKDVSAGDLTDDDRLELFEDWQRGMARIRKRKAQGHRPGA